MTDQAPAYAQALDQLRAERDAALARAKAAETEWAAIANTPDGGWHFAYKQAAARAEAAEKDRDMYFRTANNETEAKVAFRGERDAALARAEAAEKERDAAEKARQDLINVRENLRAKLAKREPDFRAMKARAEAAEAVRDALRAQLDAATAETADLAQKLSSGWIEREVDARLMADLGTGPADHERNQLRDENLRLREEVATLAAELDGARSRLTMATRDLDQSERAVSVLSTIIRASVEAIARGVK